MAYTTPSTVTGADILSASLWNTQIRDNMEELRNPVSCEVCLTSNVTGYSSGAQITWQGTNWDNTPSGMWAASPQPTWVTVPEDGIYLLTFRYTFLPNPVPVYITSTLRVNGNPVDADTQAYQFLSGHRQSATLTTQVPLSANDYIQASVTPNYSSLPSSPNHTLYGASTRYSDQTRMSVTRISDV